MNSLRSPLFFGLVLLISTAGYCKERTDLTELRENKTLFNLILEIINQLQKHREEETNEVDYFPQPVDYTFDSREFPDNEDYRKEERV
eukprot:g44465.t1